MQLYPTDHLVSILYNISCTRLRVDVQRYDVMTRSMSLRPFLGSSGPLSECLVRSHWPIFPPIEIYPRPSHSPRSAVRHFCTATMHTALATRCHSTRAPLLLLTRPTNLKRRLHVYTHGEGFLGCLGHGDFKKQHESLPVAALAAKDIRAVSAGWTHSAAICADGELLVWGRPYDVKQPLRINRIQRLVPLVVSAINALANKSELLARPVKIPIVSKPPTTTTAPTPSPPPPVIATQSAATSRSATVAGGNLDAGGATPAAQLASPDGTTSVRAASVACSAGLTVVLTDEGRVFCMGYNRWGQCGQGPENVFTVFEPLLVGGKVLENERVTKLAVGFQQVLVLCESGAVYGWGKGLRGQLGIGGELIELPVRGAFFMTTSQYHSVFNALQCFMRHVVGILHGHSAWSGIVCFCCSA